MRGGERDTATARSGSKDGSRPPTKKKKACSTCARLTGVLEKFKAAMDPLAERAKRGNACLVSETFVSVPDGIAAAVLLLMRLHSHGITQLTFLESNIDYISCTIDLDLQVISYSRQDRCKYAVLKTSLYLNIYTYPKYQNTKYPAGFE